MKNLLVIAAFLTGLSALIATADEENAAYTKCVSDLANAARALVARDYKDNPPLGIVPLAAMDNLICEEKEVMANVAIKIRLEGNVEQFGIFHLHATRDGKIASVSVEEPWTTFTTMAEFKISWCRQMNWRQKSLEEQGCVNPPRDDPARHGHHSDTQ